MGDSQINVGRGEIVGVEPDVSWPTVGYEVLISGPISSGALSGRREIITLDFVFPDVDERWRIDHCACEVVHHLALGYTQTNCRVRIGDCLLLEDDVLAQLHSAHMSGHSRRTLQAASFHSHVTPLYAP